MGAERAHTSRKPGSGAAGPRRVSGAGPWAVWCTVTRALLPLASPPNRSAGDGPALLRGRGGGGRRCVLPGEGFGKLPGQLQSADLGGGGARQVGQPALDGGGEGGVGGDGGLPALEVERLVAAGAHHGDGLPVGAGNDDQ